ncbi:hypothetical protein JCM3774_004342 [Rhodotorula dairenensis]
MSRPHTPPDQVESTHQASSSRKHQLRHRSPRGQRGRPRVGVASSSTGPASAAPSPSLARGQDASATGTGGNSSTRHRLRDKALASRQQPGPGDWLLSMWSQYRRQVTIAATLLVLLLVISAIRIAFHTADYSAASVYPPHRPVRPVTPRKPSSVSLKPEPSIAGPIRAAKPKGDAAAAAAGGDQGDEQVLHEALDSAVRHALEDAWQLPPHAPPSGAVGTPDQVVLDEQDGGGGGAAEDVKPQRSLAELYADLEELGISAHELNEVLDEAMRSTGDR